MKKSNYSVLGIGLGTAAVLACLFGLSSRVSADVDLNKDIPDENFRAYLKANYDQDNDGKILDDERTNVREMDISNLGIKSLKGIENFTSLWRLYAGGNELTEVDLTSNLSLLSVELNNNKITSVKLPDELFQLNAISLEGNNLTSFTLKGKFPQLKIINFAKNNLTSFSLEISGTPKEITNNDQLDCKILVNGNSSLTEIKGKPLFPLKVLNISDTKIEHVDDSLLAELTEINFSNSPFKDYNKLPSTLIFLYCSNAGVTSLDCSKMTELSVLECKGNSISSLDLSNTDLSTLDCSNNAITKLSLPSRKGGTFDCSGNKLTELTTNAAELNCSNNQITKLTVGTNIKKLDASHNALTSYEIRGGNLTEVDLSYNKLEKLSIYKSPKLEKINVTGNNLSADDITADSISGDVSKVIEGTVKETTTPTPLPTSEPTKKPTPTSAKKPTATPTAGAKKATPTPLPSQKKATATPTGGAKKNSPTPAGKNTDGNNNSSDSQKPSDNTADQTVDKEGNEITNPSAVKGDTVTIKGVKYKLLSNGKAILISAPASIKKLSIPATVKSAGKTYKVSSIADKAFNGKKKLTSITIGKNVKAIGKNAFANCAKLSSVKGMKALTSIGNQAFAGCKSLKTFTITSKVKKLGAKIFDKDKKLSAIIIKSSKLTSKNVNKTAFNGTKSNVVVKVPKSKLKAYKTLLKKKGLSSKATVKKA